MKKRGWLTGKFAPLHAGHINFIQQAATLCDELTVVLSHNANRFDDPKLALKTRLLYLRQTFKDIPHIKITFVDETDVPEYPNGWAECWTCRPGAITESMVLARFPRLAGISASMPASARFATMRARFA